MKTLLCLLFSAGLLIAQDFNPFTTVGMAALYWRATPGTPVLDAPDFSQPQGTYSNSVTVSITNTVAGSSYFWSTNGVDPTPASTAYAGPITFTTTDTNLVVNLRAIATNLNYVNSSVTSSNYTLTNVAVACDIVDTNYVDSGNFFNVGDASNAGGGEREFTPSSSYSLCKVAVSVYLVNGDLTGISYVCKIYDTNSGGCNLGSTLLATSSTVAGQAWNTGDWIEFSFSPALAVTNGVFYDINVTRSDAGSSGVNYLQLRFCTTGGTLSGFEEGWSGATCLVGSTTAGRDAVMRVYKQTP